ncbi:hypothetical protein BpHYR1_025843 [Brachionus plicatilis]|uniref:Uncharacterized protein n=1 Tax=Brachionus plicatilis TaxID=10195 RepID=A0A3M7PF14_BRAPC|nr:hypothetical protein BpHYR1_025843 [Brachionus plicatilis]
MKEAKEFFYFHSYYVKTEPQCKYSLNNVSALVFFLGICTPSKLCYSKWIIFCRLLQFHLIILSIKN